MEKNSAMPSVLIIDNNPERVILLVEILEASRYNVSAPLRLQQDITDQVSRLKPDIILIGVDFPGQGGAQLGCSTLRELPVSDSHVFT